MLGTIFEYSRLPAQITTFERNYLARMNRIALVFFAAHVPVLMIVAAVSGTGPLKAGLLALLALTGPLLAARTFDNPRHVSKVYGFTAMCMGALLVHFGQGPMQIEMHFYFFVLLALLAVFADPAVILIAAATVASHHLLLFFLMPRSVFNYEASLWAVAVHALFVVLESVAACFVARQFFDNVIGLEKVVQGRTEQLAERSHHLRLMLDNVGQGFLTFDNAGLIASERSAILERWLGPCGDKSAIWDYLARVDENVAACFRMGWEAVTDDVLPLELALAQMPKRVLANGLVLELAYKPIFENATLSQVLLIISDVTSHVERERSQAEARETMSVFESVLKDRAGFMDFMGEAGDIVRELTRVSISENELKRGIHTLKGNCGLFGVTGMSALCHELEERLSDGAGELSDDDRGELVARWSGFATKFTSVFGEVRERLDVSEAEYSGIVRAVADGAPRADILASLEGWRMERTEVRLSRIAEFARGLARRMNKGDIEVKIEPNGLRLTRARWAPLWNALVHVIRNAVDHGLETEEERIGVRKSAVGRLAVQTALENDELVIRVSDDGRGINWPLVRQRAQGLGLPCGTPMDLSAALFESGLTTKNSATDVSGRGVGMNAVRAICEEMGGTIRVESREGYSTDVEMRIPRALHA